MVLAILIGYIELLTATKSTSSSLDTLWDCKLQCGMHLFTVYMYMHIRLPRYINFVLTFFMKSCWALMPMSRLTFADIVTQLPGYLECIASYVILSDVNKDSKDIEVKCSDKGSIPMPQVEQSVET